MNDLANNKKLLSAYSFEETQSLKKEIIWQRLAQVTVEEALSEWFSTLSSLTAKNYLSGMKKLADVGLINIQTTLQSFALINHDAVIDNIKNLSDMTESTKQARAACYISFTRFLSRRTQNMIAKVIPCREGTEKTFYRIREKVSTPAMNRAQWTAFFDELHKLNHRDCLIAKIILQGGKRMNEVLSLQCDQINFQTNEITFKQSKTRGYEKETIITYPDSLFIEVKNYIGGRNGLVFITKNNQYVMPNQLAITFAKAGEKAQIPFKVTPHVLRASTVTYLKGQGFADSDIMKVTGHASAEMIHAYDKSDLAQNASKKINLI
jgi:integrase/recombinase XerD